MNTISAQHPRRRSVPSGLSCLPLLSARSPSPVLSGLGLWHSSWTNLFLTPRSRRQSRGTHTFGDAVTESLVLRHAPVVLGKAPDMSQ